MTDSITSLEQPGLDERQQRLRRTLESLTGIAFTEGNQLTVLRNGDRIFPAMLRAIEEAERSVDLMTYVYWKGEIATRFADTLSAAARRGVRVRLLIDAVGGLQIEKGLVDRMDEAGVHVEWFRKPWLNSPLKQNHRCHRKVLVVDEQIAFTGGVGIAEEWCGDARNEREWRDTHVEVRGPAVDGLRAAFAQNWAESGRELYDDNDSFRQQPQTGTTVAQVVRGSASIGWDDLQSTFRVLLDSATERISLATAYFAPDDFFLDRLCAAAERGVEVDVLLPGPHADKRVCQLASEAAYEQLTSCGVRVWNFQPAMMHAKIMIVDGVVSVVGSGNFDNRSLELNDEITVAVIAPDLGARLTQAFEADAGKSKHWLPAEWPKRPWHWKVREMFWGIFGEIF